MDPDFTVRFLNKINYCQFLVRGDMSTRNYMNIRIFFSALAKKQADDLYSF